MRLITERVSAEYLQQPSPRPIRYAMVLELILDHLFERPIRAFLDPILIVALIALGAMAALGGHVWLMLVPIAVVVIRTGQGIYFLSRRIQDDLALLRYGLLIRAHILKLRPHRTTAGEIEGALLDCAIPIAPRRTYVGSVWLADGNEALRLSRQGRIDVICAPRLPGIWRMAEQVRSEVRYERMASVQPIPQEA